MLTLNVQELSVLVACTPAWKASKQREITFVVSMAHLQVGHALAIHALLVKPSPTPIAMKSTHAKGGLGLCVRSSATTATCLVGSTFVSLLVSLLADLACWYSAQSSLFPPMRSRLALTKA
jgi:hypothetical protein